MAGRNNKRMSKRNQVVVTEMHRVCAEAMGMLQAFGIPCHSNADIPGSIEFLIGQVKSANQKLAARQAEDTSPQASSAPRHAPAAPEVIDPEEFELPMLVSDDQAVTPQQSTAIAPSRRRSIFDDTEGDLVMSRLGQPAAETQGQPSSTEQGAPQPVDLDSLPEAFNSKLQAKMQNVDGDLQWDETQQRYVGKTHRLGGGGGMPGSKSGAARPTKELLSVDKQREIMSKVLKKNMEAPPDSGIINR